MKTASQIFYRACMAVCPHARIFNNYFCHNPQFMAPDTFRSSSSIWLPVSLGFLIFLLLFGTRPLNPMNMAWMDAHGDTLQAWLGWTFFRQSPWSWPPGLNILYGLELGNSIVYTDSLPLLAIPLKAVADFLPRIFQYAGYWLLACVILQIWFAWKLLGLYIDSLLFKTIASIFFILSPVLLVRMTGHHTLVGQFLILAALYLCLKPEWGRRHGLGWLALLITAALTHAYLLLMASVLLCSDCVARLLHKQIHPKQLAVPGVALAILLPATMWFAGYFSIKADSMGGFGIYKMNLLSLVDSNGMSLFLRDIPGSEGEYEGVGYLGAGGILLLIWLFPGLISGKISLIATCRHRWILFSVCLFLALIAVSNQIGFGPKQIGFPIPEFFNRYFGGIFRASGRMFWPGYYLIMLWIVVSIPRLYKYRLGMILLACAMCAQVIDLKSILGTYRAQNNDLLRMAEFQSPLWDDPRYANIRMLPFKNPHPAWDRIGPLAAIKGKGTDGIYTSRNDAAKVANLHAHNELLVREKNFDPHTIYIVDDEVYSILRDNVPGAFTGIVDGFNVIAPGWQPPDSDPADAS